MGRSVNYETANRRWAGLGPYYAMFPTAFADRVVRHHTEPGDSVLDPFAGRGTSLFSAATQNRVAIGIELNPVGFVYAKTKLTPGEQGAVTSRVLQIGRAAAANRYAESARTLPPFFHHCFAPTVRRFLVAARDQLDWRRSTVDRTTMAILLVYLHGKEGAALSNQMRQTKSMSPDYAIRWWGEHGTSPPRIDPVEFLTSRLEWRYARGIPRCESSTVYMGDSLIVLPRLAKQIGRGERCRVRLLFTSPPYFGITNYHYDQWLRLWLLGGPPHAKRNGDGLRGKFEHRARYRTLLEQVFGRTKPILHKDATVYVRTDARRFTRQTTIAVLRNLFPRKQLSIRRRPITGTTQTHLFGDFDKKVGEIDVILRP